MKFAIFALSLWAAADAAQTGAAVRGVVVDARGGEVLARVQVILVGTEFRAITDPQGRFEIPGVPAGEYTLNVSTVGYRMVKKPFALAEEETKDFEVALSPDTLRQTDRVEVRSGPFDLERYDSPSQIMLSGTDAKNLASVLADDPLRAVQSLPGVTSNDDFDARFSLRGADYSRIGLYLDGVLLHSPFHMVAGETASGSATAFNGDMVEDMELHSGAYPARFPDRTAGVLDVHTRDGNRNQTSFRASASASNAGVMAEGPLGKKGSWLAGARKSYLQYLIERVSSDPSIAFGLWDAQSRVTYDLTPRNNVSLNILEGFSDLDRSSGRNKLGVNSVMTAGYHMTIVNLAWRYSPGERLMVTNRGAYMREKYDNDSKDRLSLEAGRYTEWFWTSTVAWTWNARAPLEAGVSIRRMGDQGYRNQYQFNPFAVRPLEDYRGTAVQAGGFVEQGWNAFGGKLNLSAGGRWDRASVDGVAAFSPHAAVAFAPRAGTRIHFGFGQYVQYPELQWLYSRVGGRGLLPERATHHTVAVEQRIGDRTRVRLEVYDRQDRDLLFRPWYEPRLLNGKIFNPPAAPAVLNSTRGYSRGVEMFLQSRSANRLTGWVSYAYGHAQLRDGVAGVSFPADQDQRHTVNVYGGYRLRPSVNLSLRWLYGSGFPLPGFLRKSGTLYYLSAQRNATRLGDYQRADFRINKAWTHDRWKMTLYGEVVNLMNCHNYRFDSFNGYNSRTGQASVTLDNTFPILPSVGIVLEK